MSLNKCNAAVIHPVQTTSASSASRLMMLVEAEVCFVMSQHCEALTQLTRFMCSFQVLMFLFLSACYKIVKKTFVFENCQYHVLTCSTSKTAFVLFQLRSSGQYRLPVNVTQTAL